MSPDTLKSVPPMEDLPPVEEMDAIPEEELMDAGDVPLLSIEQIRQNEEAVLNAIPLTPNQIEDEGAAQAATMLNVGAFSTMSPEEVAFDIQTGGKKLEEVNSIGVSFQESVNQAADESLIGNPSVPLQARSEAVGRLQNPLGYVLDKYTPVLPQQFVEGLAHQESVRYGAGTYAPSGVDAIDAINTAYADGKPTFGPVEWLAYVGETKGLAAELPEEETRRSWESALENATTPEQVEQAIRGAASYADKNWHFWSTQGLKMLLPGNDQYNWAKVEGVFEKHGIRPAASGAIDPDGALGTATDYLGAGGMTQRDYTDALKSASPATRKKVALDLLRLYDGKSGLDVYLSGLLTRMASGNPNVVLDVIGTLAPVASGPGDLALGVAVLNKSQKIARLPVSIIAKTTPSAVGDAIIRNATQTGGDLLESAAAGNKMAQKTLDLDEAGAALHVSPSANVFTDPSWFGSKAVISETSKRAQRHIAELDQVFGGFAADLLTKTPDEIIGRISSHAKASGVAMLAKGASKVVKSEGGFSYEAVYRAADGNGFDTLKQAQEAAKQFGSKSESVRFAYEEPITGAKGMLRQPPKGMTAEQKASWRAAEKAVKNDLKVKWSIVRKGFVTDDYPDELVFGKVDRLVDDADNLVKANGIHRFVDPNSTANRALHADLNRISGEHSRLVNLLNNLFTGRTNIVGSTLKSDMTYITKLGNGEQQALSKGIRMAEQFEDEARILGQSPSIPLTALEGIPGWSSKTTDAFIEYINNTKVFYYTANINLRRQAIVDGFKRYTSESTGKAVNARKLNMADWVADLQGTGAGKRWTIGPDGKTKKALTTSAAESIMLKDSDFILTQLHQPFFHEGKWITHQVMDKVDMVEGVLPPTMLNAKAIYSPRIHKGSHVVMGKTDTGEWVAIGMAENARFALQGVDTVKADARLMESFPGGITSREIKELGEKSARVEGFDKVDGQLQGIVYGTRNDNLAYFGSDDVGQGLADPIEALFDTVNKLAVGKKDSEIAYRRKMLTKAAQQEGVLDEAHVGVIVDDFSRFSTAPDKVARAEAYKDAFKNLNAMVEVNNAPLRMWSNNLNKMAQALEQTSLKSDGLSATALEKLAEGARYFGARNTTPFAGLQHWYTRLVISGKPIRQNIMQRSSSLINIYRPTAFAKGWWANSALDNVLSAMDDVLYTGGKGSDILLQDSLRGFASRLGTTEAVAEKIAKEWRAMGGYDAITSHLYAGAKYRMLQNTPGNASTIVHNWRAFDDKVYGTMGRLGFENGERFAQRVAFLTEVAEDLGKGVSMNKVSIQEAMGRAADKTGNMRSEFRISPGNGWLTLAAQFITYPTRMAMNTMPIRWGGSMRFSPEEKLKIIATQAALFGTVAYPVFEAAMWAADNYALAGNLSEEETNLYKSMSEPWKKGVVGEWVFNKLLEELTGEEADYDLSGTFSSTGGISYPLDVMAGLVDGNMVDVLINSKMMDSTRILSVFTLADMTFNRAFNGAPSPEMMDAAMLTEFTSVMIPTLDSGWLAYISASQNALVSKKGTPTGEAYSSVKATLRYGFGIRDNDDAMLYKAMEKARLLEGKGGTKQALSTAQKRADLMYKLIVNKVALMRASGNTATPTEEALQSEIFNSVQTLVSFLPPDEAYLLREALKKKHDEAVVRRPLDEHAQMTLAQAMLSSKAGLSDTQSTYDWAALQFPEDDRSLEVQVLFDKVKEHLTNVTAYNKSGEE